jgi:hypothetical protein
MRQRNCEKTALFLCLEVEFLSLPPSCVDVSSICGAPFSSTCWTKADNNSRKLLLRCGCQFPWCSLALAVPILNQTNSHNIQPKYILKIHFNIFTSTVGSSRCYLPLSNPDRNVIYSYHHSHASYTSLILSYLAKNKNYELCNFLQPPVTFCLLCPSVFFFRPLFSSSINQCAVCNIKYCGSNVIIAVFQLLLCNEDMEKRDSTTYYDATNKAKLC